MTIVFVVDTYGVLTNGTTITAYRFVEALRARGHKVRVVGLGLSGPDAYPLSEWRIPIVSRIAARQSTRFAKPERQVLREAFTGADVVHFLMPWRLARYGAALARDMGIAHTAAFHVQPENITYGAGLGRLGAPLARIIYLFFRLYFYDGIGLIHCPSPFIARELRRHRYRGRSVVISNGVGSEFYPGPEPPEIGLDRGADGDIEILMIGRYAPEKRQDVLIRAIGLSRYASRIRLTLAGAGPNEARLRRMAAGLSKPCRFGFLDGPELRQALARAHIYVHAADVEIEAISCLEAMASGKLAIISDSPKSATGQFALDQRCLFKAGQPRDLANKIDFWIEHGRERRLAQAAYVERASVYSLDYSIQKAERMFQDAQLELGTLAAEASGPGRRYKARLRRGLPSRLLSPLLYYLVAVPLLCPYVACVLHLRVRGLGNLWRVRWGGGAITVANHVHVLDSAMSGLMSFPKKPLFASQPSNFKLPLAGFFVRALGGVPTPSGATESRIFFRELGTMIRRGRFVHIFPEGELQAYCPSLRELKLGAFLLSAQTQAPIVPMGISFRPLRSRLLPFLPKRGIVIKIGQALYPTAQLMERDSAEELRRRTRESLLDLIG